MQPLIIFDLDGTLYDTNSSFPAAVTRFLQRYDKPHPGVAFVESLVGEPGHVFAEWFSSLAICKPLESLFGEFDEIERAAVASGGKLFPSTIPTLEILHTRGSTMGICSNGPAWYVGDIVERFELGRFMSFVRVPRARDDTKQKMIAEILENHPHDGACVVGDRHHDLNGARSNGVPFIGARFGFGGEELRDADYLIGDLDELPDIVDRLFDA